MNEISKLIDGTITEVKLDNTVTKIGNSAFYGCKQLKYIEIPDTVTLIDEYAVVTQSDATSVLINATTPPTLVEFVSQHMWPFGASCYLFVPAGYADTYKAATGWSTYSSRIYDTTEPVFVQTEHYCELDGNNKKTGYMINVTEDINPKSSTFRQTTETRVASNECLEKGFYKVTDANDLTDDWYLLVYETGGKAFNSRLTTSNQTVSTGSNAANNFVSVNVSNGFIPYDENLEYACVYYYWTYGYLGSSNGYYLYRSSSTANGLLARTSSYPSGYYITTVANSTGGYTFSDKYNTYNMQFDTTGPYFRWYSSSSKEPVCLYKLKGQ